MEDLATSLPKIVTAQVPGPKAAAILERRNKAIPAALSGSTYPIVPAKGAGAMFEDVDGNRFVDFVGGVGVLNIGYSRPEVVKAVQDQAGKFFHGIFNIYAHEGYVTLAEMLNETMPVKGDEKKTYFANSGAEADENAIKVAKAFTGRQGVICFSGAFHGRTNLTMAITAKKVYAQGMGPFPAEIYRAPFPYVYRAPKGYTEEQAIQYYLDELNLVFDEGIPAKEVACMIVEPVQGEGGFIPAPIEWVKAIRKICDDNGIMLIADEVQCGNCRTGKYYASEYWKDAGCAPDIIATAKSLGAGVPISAICARKEIMDAVPNAVIGGTYCGNPLACASGIETMKIMKKEDFCGKALKRGAEFMDGMKAMQKKYPVIGDVRGLGAMCGVEFVLDPETKEPATALVASIVQKGIQKGLLLECCGQFNNVIRFLAPLNITDEQMKAGMDIFEECIKEASAEL